MLAALIGFVLFLGILSVICFFAGIVLTFIARLFQSAGTDKPAEVKLRKGQFR